MILSLLQPPRPGVDVHGTYKRIALYVRALHAQGFSVEIAYYVTDAEVAPSADLGAAARKQEAAEAAYWGFPVRVHLLRRRAYPTTFANYYLRGIASAGNQPAMAPWAGPAQAEGVGALLDSGPDLVVVNNLHATCALLQAGRRPKRLFADLDDVQHLVRLRWCRTPPLSVGKALMLSHIPALLLAERKAASLAERMFVCSEADRRHLARLGFPRVTVVPNAAEIPPHPAKPTDEPTLTFVGGIGHTPNREAAERMVRHIFPLVRARRADARLIIAGQGSEELGPATGNPPGVEFRGFVPDIEALYDRTAVFVCPMLNGGGTRIKLLDAAAYGLPVVSTRMGASGILFEDGRDALLRDSDQAFAEACLHLLSHPAEARRLGSAARRLMQDSYDARAIQRQLGAMFAPQPVA
ncbi:glycosyltransferase family 4 protein [Pararoseomonas sp. SCSIO 73927]|uniref:glycosyltransferase family 4 protein n=1 Tax=Pararoseomonas sp. SCSIO 73927 TaxID=3114537 RepID=UPI0030CE54D7